MTVAQIRRFTPFITRLFMLPALAFLAGPGSAWAETPDEVASQRQHVLDSLLTSGSHYSAAAERFVCAMGQEPATVLESRAGGAAFTPDASEGCVTSLMRVAHDGALPELYSKLLTELGGDTGVSEQLPRAIGAVVLGGKANVAIGNGKAAAITPALAFDAGFSVAYQDGNAARPPAMAQDKLTMLTEACLAQKEDAGACFSAGYIYGAQAFDAQASP